MQVSKITWYEMLQVTCAILQPEHSPASDSCQTQGMVEIQQEQGGFLWQSSSPAGRFIKTLTNTDSDCSTGIKWCGGQGYSSKHKGTQRTKWHSVFTSRCSFIVQEAPRRPLVRHWGPRSLGAVVPLNILAGWGCGWRLQETKFSKLSKCWVKAC